MTRGDVPYTVLTTSQTRRTSVVYSTRVWERRRRRRRRGGGRGGREEEGEERSEGGGGGGGEEGIRGDREREKG